MDPRRRISALVDGVSIAMLTTSAGVELRARPMLLETVDRTGALVFLTHLSSSKVEELRHDARVNVSLIGKKPERYVSISGRGSVFRDPRRIARLWNPTYRAWFPGGRTDPDLAVLVVDVNRVEYWLVPSSRIVRLWGVVRALATGRPAEAGTHGKFSMLPEI